MCGVGFNSHHRLKLMKPEAVPNIEIYVIQELVLGGRRVFFCTVTERLRIVTNTEVARGTSGLT